MSSSPSNMRPLRPGDVVVVKSAAEILATLDDQASVDCLPFMPEMAQYVGKRFTVSRRVDKICDTISNTGSRRMYSTVYLEDLRCDGSGHAGCQGGCKLYWKDAWLRLVTNDAEPQPAAEGDGVAELERLAETGARTTREFSGVPTEVWRCQATEAVKATERLSGFDLSQYWRELTNGNYDAFKFLRVLAHAVVVQIASRLGLVNNLPIRGSATPLDRPPLGLKPGDLVEVRSPSEIAETLDEDGLSRGLSFDREMISFCGKQFRVKDRVERLVDDKTGRLLKINRDCIILEGGVCSGENSISCWFCPRQIYAYHRESWLRLVASSSEPISPSGQPGPDVSES